MPSDIDPDYGIDHFLDVSTPYDYCSLMHYKHLIKDGVGYEFEKVDKYKGLGCQVGQAYFDDAQPSVLDIQTINSKYKCGKPYQNLDTCTDYFA